MTGKTKLEAEIQNRVLIFSDTVSAECQYDAVGQGFLMEKTHEAPWTCHGDKRGIGRQVRETCATEVYYQYR